MEDIREAGSPSIPLPPLALQQHLNDMKEQKRYHVTSLKRKGHRGQIDFEHLKELVLSDAFKDAAIFADELLICDDNDLQSLTSILALCEQRTVWIAITYINCKNVPIEKVKSNLNDFYVPELVNPVRNSAEVVRYAYPSLKGKLIQYKTRLKGFSP